jgi:hypothetical protein
MSDHQAVARSLADQRGHEDMSRISWVPVLDETGDDLDSMRLDTFGLARHVEGGVPVPEAGGALIDRDIAELVALLNRAGVRTFQSCHDIGDACGYGRELGPLVASAEEDDNEWYLYLDRAEGDAMRYGCIVVEWDQFPKVGPLLPWTGDAGWLFSASPDARFVSILFPWRDLEKWTAVLKAGSGSGQGRHPDSSGNQRIPGG